jgi:RNA polymerase sigma-70 factor (ECF subfamily)
MTKRERNWIKQIRHGDETAFEELFRAYYPQLCRFAAEYVDSASHARDLVQDVFLRIWARRSNWRVQRSLKAYLYQAVRNRALNHVRQQDTQTDVEDDLEYTTDDAVRRTAADAYHANTLSEEVDEAITDLPERRRMAFLLHRRHGFTYKEIAAIMDISPKTVENQIGRALKSLREKLDPLFSQKLK